MLEIYSPIRMCITGMDGSGKSSAYRAFVERVPVDLTVVRVSRFCSVIINGQEEIVNREISQALDRFHEWADTTKERGLITFANTLWVLYAWRVQEKRLTEKFCPDLVLALRDPYIDPIAYARYYNPSILGALSIEKRIQTLRRLHGAPISKTALFLDVEPSIAVQRINQRLIEEAQSGEILERAKRVHLHENTADLRSIRNEYNAVLDHFQTHHCVVVVRVDTTTHSKPEVAEKVCATLLQSFGIMT